MQYWEIGPSIRELRKEKGITQAELAVAVGVSRVTLSKLENGKLAGISIGVILSILERFDREISFIEPAALPTLEELPRGKRMNKSIVRLIAGTILAFAFGFAGAQGAGAQSHLAVELGHPVYGIIETAELRGVLSRLSSVKPYTRSQVAEFLATIEARMDAFSPAERGMIVASADEFAPGTFRGAPLWKSENGKAVVGTALEATSRIAPDGLVDAIGGSGATALEDLWHLNSRVTPYLAGAVTPWLSVKGEAGFTIDKIERDLYLPYEFTKEWDSNHIDFSDSRSSKNGETYLNGTEVTWPMFSYDIRQDIAVETDSGALMVRLSRFRRDWGVGSGSFALSGTARPFVGLEVAFRPSKYFAVSSIVGSLTNWEKGSAEKSTAMSDLNGDGIKEYSAISWQKMLGLQRMELFPFDWLTVRRRAP